MFTAHCTTILSLISARVRVCAFVWVCTCVYVSLGIHLVDVTDRLLCTARCHRATARTQNLEHRNRGSLKSTHRATTNTSLNTIQYFEGSLLRKALSLTLLKLATNLKTLSTSAKEVSHSFLQYRLDLFAFGKP